MRGSTLKMQESVGDGRKQELTEGKSKTLSRWGAWLVVGGFALSGAGCVTGTEEGQLMTFAGEWCTLRGLGAESLPRAGVPYVALVAFQEGGGILGSGSISRPGDDEIVAMRYTGTIQGNTATIQATELEPGEELSVQFSMEMQLDGVRDMVGTMQGDPDFNGPLHLVRLGPRCFVE